MWTSRGQRKTCTGLWRFVSPGSARAAILYVLSRERIVDRPVAGGLVSLNSTARYWMNMRCVSVNIIRPCTWLRRCWFSSGREVQKYEIFHTALWRKFLSGVGAPTSIQVKDMKDLVSCGGSWSDEPRPVSCNTCCHWHPMCCWWTCWSPCWRWGSASWSTINDKLI